MNKSFRTLFLGCLTFFAVFWALQDVSPIVTKSDDLYLEQTVSSVKLKALRKSFSSEIIFHDSQFARARKYEICKCLVQSRTFNDYPASHHYRAISPITT